jgi:hypothetical protein
MSRAATARHQRENGFAVSDLSGLALVPGREDSAMVQPVE